jgi:hypothetical protein
MSPLSSGSKNKQARNGYTIWRNVLSPSSGLKSHIACYLLHAGFSLAYSSALKMELGNVSQL